MVLFRKLDQLSWKDRLRLAQAIPCLLVIHIGLYCLGFRRLKRVLSLLSPLKPLANRQIDNQQHQVEIIAESKQLARIVAIAANHGFYQATCLRKSLLLWWWLRRLGIESTLQMGVSRLKPSFEAHAWVEVLHVAVNDNENVRKSFAAFDA